MLSHSCLSRSHLTTLSSVFKTRVDKTPNNEALRYFNITSGTWHSETWLDAYQHILGIRNALLSEKLNIGDRILLTLNNSPEWVYIEQAALYLGLVIVALPPNTPPAKICKVVNDVNAKMLFIEDDLHWHTIQESPLIQYSGLSIISRTERQSLKKVQYYSQWKTKKLNQRSAPDPPSISPDALATILYTSGSCGKPKGVKHSHTNLINNAFACLERIDINDTDIFLSATPIFHCLERIAGYYVSIIAGATIVYPKSAETLLEDLAESNASILITTPHYLTRAYKRAITEFSPSIKLADKYLDYKQGHRKWEPGFLLWPITRSIAQKEVRKKLLHQLRLVICGGSALPPKVARLCQTFNLPMIQGYGLTEAGGVVSTNTLKQDQPLSVGKPLSNTEIRLSNTNELQIKNDCCMLGYWNDAEPTSNDPWLNTEDLAHVNNEYLYIDGRKNNTIHLSTGDIILPTPIEAELLQDPLFEQALLYGENREQITLICQINPDEWSLFLKKYNINPASEKITGDLRSILLIHINLKLQTLTDHPKIPLVIPTMEIWSQENGLLNAMGKINVRAVEAFFQQELRQLR